MTLNTILITSINSKYHKKDYSDNMSFDRLKTIYLY